MAMSVTRMSSRLLERGGRVGEVRLCQSRPAREHLHLDHPLRPCPIELHDATQPPVSQYAEENKPFCCAQMCGR
jgi:hypothetical protein